MQNLANESPMHKEDLVKAAASFYACRASDSAEEQYQLLIETTNRRYGQKLAELKKREQEVFAQNEALTLSCGKCKLDPLMKRVCGRLSFLPRLLKQAETNGETYSYCLDFPCFDFGNLVLLSDLERSFHVDISTGYRMTFSLLVLVDWLVQMNLEIDFGVDNLLFDPESSFLIPISLMESSLHEILPMSITVSYYRTIGEIMLSLIGAEQVDGEWHTANPCEGRFRPIWLFSFLKELKDLEFNLPESVSQATTYVVNAYKRQKDFMERFSKVAWKLEINFQKPYFTFLKK